MALISPKTDDVDKNGTYEQRYRKVLLFIQSPKVNYRAITVFIGPKIIKYFNSYSP